MLPSSFDSARYSIRTPHFVRQRGCFLRYESQRNLLEILSVDVKYHNAVHTVLTNVSARWKRNLKIF
jgi:hypothetical protein